MLCDSDPTTYSNLVEILNKEAVERCAKKGDSCSKALLWLTRTLDFTAALLEKLVAEPRESMEQIVANSYETTLKPWHGWISASAYKVALKLVPETGTLILLLMDKGDDIDSFKNDIQAFISLLLPLLEDLHSTLSSFRLEKVKST
uniref:Glycolipid transfer protein domain-containing protein n=2 Tax=Chenopodium quinoa TaxID=63459 RepID=A0A803LHR0_CHEQI